MRNPNKILRTYEKDFQSTLNLDFALRKMEKNLRKIQKIPKEDYMISKYIKHFGTHKTQYITNMNATTPHIKL